MRRLVSGVLAGVVSCALTAPVFADPPGSVRGVGLETSNTLTTDGPEVVQSARGVYVWAISLLCATAPCEVALYDSASATSGAGVVKWEGRVSANNGVYSEAFGAPIATLNGLRVEVVGTGGNAFVVFEP